MSTGQFFDFHPPRARHRTTGIGAAWALAVAFGVGVLPAQPSPNGPELQVNTYTTSWQICPSVAADGPGGFVVAWESSGSGGTDTSGTCIEAQLFDAEGNPRGGEFQVNSYTTGDQWTVAAAARATGHFVVVWTSAGSPGTDVDESIQARRFAANGAPLGEQFQVNSYTTNYQGQPAVEMDGQGNFVVVWSSYGAHADHDGSSIQAQRYAADGAPLGGQFQVNDSILGAQRQPALDVDDTGNFVIAWANEFWSGPNSDLSIQARCFDSNGAARGSQFHVNTLAAGYQRSPAVAIGSQGRFVVAWQSEGSWGSDTDGESIQAQLFDADANPLGGQFQVNAYTTGSQSLPVAAANAAGGTVVTWRSEGSNGTDQSGWSVQAQRYRSNGAASGGEFQVNSYTTDTQSWPSVALDARGNFVVAWHSEGSSGTDTSYTSIQAQRFDALFRDGLETGDASRWTIVVP